jgi:hypothetical protein
MACFDDKPRLIESSIIATRLIEFAQSTFFADGDAHESDAHGHHGVDESNGGCRYACHAEVRRNTLARAHIYLQI